MKKPMNLQRDTKINKQMNKQRYKNWSLIVF